MERRPRPVAVDHQEPEELIIIEVELWNHHQLIASKKEMMNHCTDFVAIIAIETTTTTTSYLVEITTEIT